MAHTHGADNIDNHGTYDGRCFDVDVPMASSISCLSLGEIRGCTAGVS